MEKVYYLVTGEGRLTFEFDEAKSAANKAKHGIDFVESMQLWADGDRAETPARSDQEERFMLVGRIGGRCWSAFITYRDDRIRLISVRRARQGEVRTYGGGQDSG
jgi:uncharacterized DUF497 family protein